MNGDGKADLITGGGPGGGPRVQIFSGSDLVTSNKQTIVSNFFAGDPNTRGGARVAFTSSSVGSTANLIVGAGSDSGSTVRAYQNKNLTTQATPTELYSFDAEPGFAGGVFVG